MRAYLVPRFGTKSRKISSRSIFSDGSSRSTRWAKMRGVMSRMYKVGIPHERVANNPVLHVETRSKTDYNAIVITHEQTLAILKSLPSPLQFTSPAPPRRSALRRCWRCAGRTYCGRKDGFA